MNNFNTDQSDGGSPDEQQAARHRPELSKDILRAAEVRLDGLPTRQTMTLQEALQYLAPAIKRLRAKGYSIDEAAAEVTCDLSALGLSVSGRTLARLMPSKTRAKAQRKAA